MKISAIVPAYNEEKAIGNVIESLRGVSSIDQIVVVNDGSKDKTREIIEANKEGITVIHNVRNMGKGFSVAGGLLNTDADIILILDGDILNYSSSDLTSLYKPLLVGECDYAMKMTDNPHTKMTSGVRAYWRKDLVPLLAGMRESTRYGLEALLNKRLSHLKWIFVQFNDCKHFQKFDKFPMPKAIWEYFKEGLSIAIQIIRNNFSF